MGKARSAAVAITTGSMLALMLVACTATDFDGSKLDGEVTKPSDSASTSTQSCTSGGGATALTPMDPNTLEKCACAKGGAARCVAKDKIPSNVSAVLDTCSAGLCVPDKLVKSGGATLATCKSAFGDGRCVSTCIPQVAENAALLNRGEGDICDEDERCVPCLNPLDNNKPTGVCEIGKAAPACASTTPAADSAPAPSAVACPYTGKPLLDVTTFPSCAGDGSGMRCVPANLVPAEAGKLLATCPTGLCAPEKSIAAGGQYLPKTCRAVAGAEGRCLNKNIEQIKAQAAQLTQDSCDANELCAPCFSPLDATDTGACKSVSCDAPKEPAKSFTGCCLSQGMARAKCVPKTMVPTAQAGNLDDDDGTCQKGAELCVPNEMLQPNFKGPACTGSTFITGSYTGVCLSSCLHFGFIQSLGISTGSCQKGFKCAPCTNPLDGKPTGAPGCPGT